MAKGSSSKTKLSKVVITAKRDTNCLEVLRGYGVLSHKGLVLEVYEDDFEFALGRLGTINAHLPASRRSRLVRVVAVLERLRGREIQRLGRETKKKTKGD